jgi:tetratricopeptide (TPR) repeat protein/DNA-binding XRE family transcriptional regulator
VAIDPELVRQARLKAGLSMAQVAGSELTRQAVHLIETGKVRPSMRSLQVIARRLGVPAQNFQVPSDPGAELPHHRVAELERLCERQRYPEVIELAGQLLAGDTSVDLEAFALLYLGRAHAQLGKPDEALPHLRRARRLFEADGDPWSAAEARQWEAGALYLKEDVRAVAIGEEALRRYRALEPRRVEVEARMLEHLATFLLQQADFVRAERCYQEALQVAGSVLDLVRLGRIYHGLSRCRVGLGDSRRAIELASRAVALYAVENDLRPAPARIALPRIENDLGLMLLRDGQPGRAEEHLESALRRIDEAGAERVRSYVLLSIAELRQVQGRDEAALDLIGQAIEVAERLDERVALAAAHQQIGELRAARQEDQLADQGFERALEILEEAGMAGPREQCLAAYRRVLEARGDAGRLERSAS